MYDLGSDRQVAKVSLSLSVMASIKYETAKMLQASKEDFANQWAAIMDFMVFTIIASIAVSLP